MQKFKVILVVLGLLLIGFTGGFLTNRHLVQKQVHQLRRLGEGKGFGEMFLKRIDADQDQADQLRLVFDDYGPRFRALGESHWLARKELTDSLFQKVTPLLSDEQVQKSQRWRSMLVKPPPHKMRRHGAHPKSDH